MTTYGEVKRMVLELIDQHRMAGEEVPLSYNNQSDYVHRIPNLFNAALLEIRDVVPRLAVFHLADGQTADGVTAYDLPNDFNGVKTGGVWRTEHGTLTRTNQYRLLGRRTIMVPEKHDCGYQVEYYQAAPQLPADPPDGYELEEEPGVITAAAYYTAAHLVMLEDEFLYASLSNEYETRLQRLKPPLTAEVHPVEDLYGGCFAWPM